ncbi:MAG: response regulator, partial [Kiritimatiellae bacterium]|nr:response regulator [Kiritimatiellia bacterium]
MSKILIVDDEARILLLLQSLLKANGHETATAKDGSGALDLVRNDEALDLVITDLRMAPMDGMTLFREIKGLRPQMPVILLTAYASVETAIEAMKCGAFDYLTKPFKVDELLAAVSRAEEHVKSAATASSADPNAPLRYQFENLIATNSTMLQVCEMIQRVSP